MLSYFGSLLTNVFHQNAEEKEEIEVSYPNDSLEDSKVLRPRFTNDEFCSYDIIGVNSQIYGENEYDENEEKENIGDSNNLANNNISLDVQNPNFDEIIVKDENTNENTNDNNRNFKKQYFLNKKKYEYNFTKHNLLARNRQNNYRQKLRIKCPQVCN